MQIPIDANTFKKSFLDGNGNLEIQQDIWRTLYEAGKPFPKDAPDLVTLKFSAGTSKDFQFGQRDGLKLVVSFNNNVVGAVDLIWPGEDHKLIKTHQLENFLSADKLYVALVFRARGDASEAGSYPVGPLSATFGIRAGGSVEYERLALYNQSQTVKEILADLFAGVRLPQAVDSEPEIPALGEVLVTRHGGYLNLSAGLSWGYALAGTRSFEVRDLSPALNYALRLAAGVSFGYRLAGNFSIEALHGTDPGWVRFIVRKDRLSEFDFAADFGFLAKAKLKGLPNTADKFLAALLGTDAETVLAFLARAEAYSSLDELDRAAGKLAKGFVRELAQKWIRKALDNTTLPEFLAVAQKVAETYRNTDQRIIDLYEDYLDTPEKLGGALNILLGVGGREDLKTLTDSEAWEIIRRLWSEKFHDLLLQDDEVARFATFIKSVQNFKDGKDAEQVRALVGEFKQSFRLDDLFKQLEKYDTPEKLKTLDDEKLQGLAGQMIGKAFDELRVSELEDVSNKINRTLRKIKTFKDQWYEKLTEAVEQSFAFSLHYAYTRADKHESLLDVEINLNQPGGPRLAKKAAGGDFAEALEARNTKLVRVNKGILTHDLTRSAQIRINVMGWGYKGIVEVVQQSEHAIEAEAGGLLHVYTVDAHIKQRREKGKKFKEVVQSNFLLRAVGETLQPAGDDGAAKDPTTKEYVIGTLGRMAVEYKLLYDDERASAKELTQYLDLAEFLGLIPSRQQMLEELDRQFPAGLGRVTVNYVVRYDDQAVRNAFTLSGEGLRNWARQTARRLIAAKYTGMRTKDWLARVGFAYLDPAFYALYKKGFTALLAEGKVVRLPGWFTGGSPQVAALEAEHRSAVLLLFNVEKCYVERLAELSGLIDRSVTMSEPIPQDELERAALQFVRMADDLDSIGRENTFFAMFDKLVQEGGGRRKSAIIMKIMPPGGLTVTKYLMS